MNKKPFARSSRVAAEIQKAISELINRNVSDPRLENVTVTGVQMSRDLKIAKIYFTVYEGKDKIKRIIDGFLSARGYVKRQLAQRLGLRYMPDIVFFHDESFDYGAHMNKVLKTVIDSSEKDIDSG